MFVLQASMGEDEAQDMLSGDISDCCDCCLFSTKSKQFCATIIQIYVTLFETCVRPRTFRIS